MELLEDNIRTLSVCGVGKMSLAGTYSMFSHIILLLKKKFIRLNYIKIKDLYSSNKY